jgi:hypothetical protein
MKKPKTPRRTTTPQRQGAFRLPPGVSFQKELLASGWAYVFRHTTLGQLGRIVLEDHPDGRAQVTCEIAGDPADPMTAQRKALFEPVAMDLVRRLETQTGSVGGENVALPRRLPEPAERIASKLIQCDTCETDIALLIFAAQATDAGGLEDYARKMFPHVKAMNLPTYVLGPPLGTAPLAERPCDVLKMWPDREPVRGVHPDAFNAIIATLARTHCS